MHRMLGRNCVRHVQIKVGDVHLRRQGGVVMSSGVLLFICALVSV